MLAIRHANLRVIQDQGEAVRDLEPLGHEIDLGDLEDLGGHFDAVLRVQLVLDHPLVAVAVGHEEETAVTRYGHGGRFAEVRVVRSVLELKLQKIRMMMYFPRNDSPRQRYTNRKRWLLPQT